MSDSTIPVRRPSNYALLASMVAILLPACGSRSILGRDDLPGDVGADAVADAVLADAPVARDTPLADTPDVSLLDTPLMDTPDVPLADVLDASDVFFVDAVDAMEASTADAGALVPGILGSAARFTILAGSTVSNTGLTTVVGEIGVHPGTALVGIPAGTVVHAGDPVAALAQADTTIAYNYLAGLPCGTTLSGRDLGGMTLPPGVYCFSSSAMLTGTLFLDGQGQPDARFVFQIGSTLVTSNSAAVVMINGARPCGLYWQTGSAATIGIASNFSGNIVAFSSVTLTTGVTLNGRALARTGGVTMDTNVVSNASCPDPARPTADASDAGPADAASSDRPDAGAEVSDGPADGG